MTAKPVMPARHRPGKGPAEQSESEEEEEEEQEQEREPVPKPAPRPSVTAAERRAALAERRAKIAASEAASLEAQKAALAAAEAEFETDESDAEDSDGSRSESGSEESSEAESDSSEDSAPRRPLVRPTFIRKDQRAPAADADAAASAERQAEIEAEQARRKKEAATELVQDQIEKQQAARAAGKKAWDESDDDVTGLDAVDDTDGMDPEAERAAWKLRELKRVQRARAAVEEAEKEREERERRRALSPGARAREDEEFIAKQREEKEGKGKVGFMQRYHHKGAFFQDDLKEKGLDKRDIMGSRFVDDMGGASADGARGGKELLPEYMQIRDMAKLGRKGRTKYRDLRTEDTGRWGVYDDRRGGKKDFSTNGVDERFMPDRKDGRGREGPTGANATAVKDRRHEPNGRIKEEQGMDRNGHADVFWPDRDQDQYHEEDRVREKDRHRDDYKRRRDRSYSRSPPSRRRSYSRSPPRRKRSISPFADRDKRRRVD